MTWLVKNTEIILEGKETCHRHRTQNTVTGNSLDQWPETRRCLLGVQQYSFIILLFYEEDKYLNVDHVPESSQVLARGHKGVLLLGNMLKHGDRLTFGISPLLWRRNQLRILIKFRPLPRLQLVPESITFFYRKFKAFCNRVPILSTRLLLFSDLA
jgi:hypothetical protein